MPVPRTCAAAHCDGKEHIFSWPGDEKIARKWTAFVSVKVANFKPKSTSRLCFRHFQPSDFHNWSQYTMMTDHPIRLILKPNSVPSVQFKSKDDKLPTPRKQEPTELCEREQRVVKRNLLTTREPPVEREITLPVRRPVPAATAVLPPISVDVGDNKGTQTYAKELRPKFRSKALQCTVKHVDMGCNTDESMSNFAKEDCKTESSPSESLTGTAPEDDVVEVEDEDFEYPEKDNVEDDPDWLVQSDDEEEYQEEERENKEKYKQSKGKWFDEPKYIVAHSNLLQLLETCEHCSSQCNVDVATRHGSYVKFVIKCATCKHSRLWETSEKVGQKSVLNILLTSIIVFCGLLPTQFLRALGFINLCLPSEATFFHYQGTYLHGVVKDIYERKMDEIKVYFNGILLDVTGDGRFDTPGHSATYGLYTLMDTETSIILSSTLVKCTETTSSPAMELEGLIRCRNEVEEAGLTINSITTDQHISIRAHIRDCWPEVTHYFDAWHIAKGLRKKLNQLSGSKKANKVIGKWIPAIINHLYYVILHAEAGERAGWWSSVIKHICNNHDSCHHDELSYVFGDDGKQYTRDWILPESQLAYQANDILVNTRLITAINMAGRNTTSELEYFHSHLNRYIPKMQSFSYHGMLTRSHIAVIHHNENSQRGIKLKQDGSALVVGHRSKATGLTPVPINLRDDPTYHYIEDFFNLIEEHLSAGTIPEFNVMQPPTLASRGAAYESVSELVARPRGLKTKPHYVSVETE